MLEHAANELSGSPLICSEDTERALLGAIMLNPDRWNEVADLLQVEDFAIGTHRVLFSEIGMLVGRGDAIDVISILASLERSGRLEAAGGRGFVAAMARDAYDTSNVVAYADLIRDRTLRRRLRQTGQEVVEMADAPEHEKATDAVAAAEALVFSLGETANRGRREALAFRDVLRMAIEEIDERFNAGNAVTGLSTGLSGLDAQTSGLQRGDLIVVAGRPSMGKTSLALGFMAHAACNEGKTCLLFSLEMPAVQIALRLIAAIGRVDHARLRSGQLEDADWPKLTAATAKLSDAGIVIEDDPGVRVSQMRARAMRAKQRLGHLDLIVVDYLQLVQAESGSRDSGRERQIAEASRGLKLLARELDVPVVALSQLNRSVEQRPNKRPVNSDLRDSGAVEQDADVIAFVYRDEVYNPETEYRGEAELIIGKQRNGPIGTVRTVFQGPFCRFADLCPDRGAP